MVYKDRKLHKEVIAGWQRELRKRLRKAVLIILGSKCAECGITDYRVLQIDHKKSDGREDRKKFSSEKIQKNILQMSDTERNEKYQLLCANCNWIKVHEKNEGPKRKYYYDN